MRKITKILSGVLTTLFLCVLVFSLSSKSDPIYDDPVSCEDTIDNNLCDAQIRLTFNQTAVNPYRNIGFENYTPIPDAKIGYFPGGNSLSETDNWYCTVIITTDECNNWEWSKTYDSNTNVMNVKLPVGYNTRMKVTYYERSENLSSSQGPVTPDFNKPIVGSFTTENETRVVYRYERTFLGGWCGFAPEQLNLSPNGHLSQFGEVVSTVGSGDDIIGIYFDDFYIIP